MPITSNDAVLVVLDDNEIHDLVAQANEIALNIVDRHDLHERDHLERVINVLLGEIAEYMVIKWLRENGTESKPPCYSSINQQSSNNRLVYKRRCRGGRLYSIRNGRSANAEYSA